MLGSLAADLTHIYSLLDDMFLMMCTYINCALVPGGPWDLYVGQTDRGVSVYHWNEDTKQLDLVSKFSLSGQVSSHTTHCTPYPFSVIII